MNETQEKLLISAMQETMILQRLFTKKNDGSDDEDGRAFDCEECEAVRSALARIRNGIDKSLYGVPKDQTETGTQSAAKENPLDNPYLRLLGAAEKSAGAMSTAAWALRSADWGEHLDAIRDPAEFRREVVKLAEDIRYTLLIAGERLEAAIRDCWE